jgi:voltage-gated potassium channel Kch
MTLTSNQDPVPVRLDNPYSKHCQYISNIWARSGAEPEEIFFLQRIVQTLLCLLLFFTIAMALRWLGGMVSRACRKISIELYAVGKCIGLIICLTHGAPVSNTVALIAAYFLFDLFANLSGFILLRHHWRPPASLTRSLILLAINFIEICTAFAILYLFFGCVGTPGKPAITSGASAMYFSIITAATVGYGDIVPLDLTGQKLVATQVVMSLFFMAVILSHFVSQMQVDRSVDQQPGIKL